MRIDIKDHIRESRIFSERAVIALVIVVIMIAVIISRLVYLQIIYHEHYATLSDGNRIHVVPIPPTRGLIYDRNGVLLAQNLPSFSLTIIPEQVDDIEQTIKELSQLITISDRQMKQFHKQLKRKRAFKNIPLRLNLSEAEVARFSVNRHRFPGVEIEAILVRNYPLGSFAVHAIGYVGRINDEELQKIDLSNYIATRYIGKIGVEKYYEARLHGTVGYKHVETNAKGRVIRVLKKTPPIPGANLYLTIDARLQKAAEDALQGKRGAIVAIEPNTGEVLAMASMPGYDPNLFVTGIDTKTFNALNTSLDTPLFNRALKGQYPPGSTLKPFIGLAGLDLGKTRLYTSTFCPGWYSLKNDDHRYRDWKHQGHGLVNISSAIAQSCDVYFYDLALTLGIDNMHNYLAQFGFGKRTQIDLYGEAKGILPSRQWKRKNHNQPWYPGETLITGIGQGYTLTTPLQLASATAILASRGTMIQPRIVHSLEDATGMQESPLISTTLPRLVNNQNLKAVIKAMKMVVHSSRGTARAIGYNSPYKIAGKTGTAQVFGIKQDEKYNKEEVAERLRDHALFIAFAPIDKPKIALAIIVENGGSGSSSAAPIARKIMDIYLKDPKT